eukprot:6286788-Pyramimonas_sp.AAC.1
MLRAIARMSRALMCMLRAGARAVGGGGARGGGAARPGAPPGHPDRGRRLWYAGGARHRRPRARARA